MDTSALVQFIRLGRFRFLLAGFLPFLAGAFFALLRGADVTLAQFLLGYSAMACAHLSTNYSNDVFDADADRFGEVSPISGGSGVLVQEPSLKSYAKGFALGLMALSIAIGWIFLTIYSFPIYFLVFGVAGNLIGWYYTAPPIRLAYRGLGEVTNMITFGLLMPGSGYFVAMGTLDLPFFLFSIPFFLYGLVFITSVEMPDREGDIAGGKPTLIVRKGRLFGFGLIALAAFVASCTTVFFAFEGLFSPLNFWPVVLISFIPLGIALWGFRHRCVERIPALRYVQANILGYLLFTGLVAMYLILVAFPVP